MHQSEHINELASSLAKAQGEMQAAIKDKVNPFFKSTYADLGSVWDAARPVLSKNGLAVVQTTEMNNDQIILVTTLIHSSGQWMKSYLPLILTKKDSQGIGAAITYLRRYSLSAIVGVVCDEDDDGETACGRGKNEQNHQKQKPQKEDSKNPPFEQMIDDLRKILNDCGNDYEIKILNHYKVDHISKIPKEHLLKVINNSLAFRELKIKQQESQG